MGGVSDGEAQEEGWQEEGSQGQEEGRAPPLSREPATDPNE
jgi:hypothetical protein